MPIYGTRCPDCDKEDSIYRTVAERDVNIPACLYCGGEMQRVVSAPMVMTDIQPYRSVVDGSLIGSRSAHRDHLIRHNCTEVGNEKFPERPREVRGDFNLRGDLAAATHEVLGKTK